MWRVWQPFLELQQRGFIADWCHKDDSEKALPLVAAGRYNLVVTPRIVWPAEGMGDRWLSVIHKAGMAWVYEVDDDVYSPTITDRQMRIFETEREKGRTQLEWERNERIRLLQKCDGVSVSSQRLATIVRMHAPESTPVKVIPNVIDAQWFRQVMRGIGRIPELEGKLTIGWAGGAREEVDLIPLAQAWTIIAEKYPHVYFVIQGHISPTLAESVLVERRSTLPWLPLHEYPRALVNFSIGCCAVAPMGFNVAKTAIKWYEMTLAGVPTVCSHTLYGKEVTDGEDGLLATTTEEWVTQLSRLIESEDLRKQINRNARQKVMEEHTLEKNWANWPLAWVDIIEKFREKQARKLVLAHA